MAAYSENKKTTTQTFAPIKENSYDLHKKVLQSESSSRENKELLKKVTGPWQMESMSYKKVSVAKSSSESGASGKLSSSDDNC